jgi:hypothetical protein
MTTVIDPAGSPIPVFNRSGKTIVEVTDSRDGSGSPLQLTQYSEQTYYEIAFTYPGGGVGTPKVELPSNAEIGDEIIINFTLPASMNVIAAVGETIMVDAGTTLTPSSPLSANAFRAIRRNSTSWRLLHVS